MLVKSLTAKEKIEAASDAVKAHYLDCYYYMVFFLYMDAKANAKTDPAASLRNTANAANFIVQSGSDLQGLRQRGDEEAFDRSPRGGKAAQGAVRQAEETVIFLPSFMAR